MPAKKKALTKTESNKLYLARKKAKKEAAMFEEVLEVPVLTETTEPKEADFKDEEIPPPTNTDFDDDDWQPYAPKSKNVPLAAGETQETSIKPGDWHSPEVIPTAPSNAHVEKPIVEAQDALEESPIQFSYNLPTDSVERLQQAIDAIKWLSQKNKDLPPRTKEILRLRIARLEEIIYALK